MNMFWRKKREQDLERELHAHLQLEGEEQRDAWAARRALGNTALIKEDVRAVWGGQRLERLAQDLRYACRTLYQNRGFATLALAVLALGIGATTAAFSVVNSVLLRPLPFRDPDRLVMVWERPPQGKTTNVVQTQNFLDWRQSNRSFENIAAVEALPVNLESGTEAVQLPGMVVSAGFFEILGVRPLLGRTFRPEEDVPNAQPVVVLSYGLWQGRFGGKSSAIGESVTINGQPARVIGVMPRGFAFPTVRAELYGPARINPATAPQEGRNYMTVARLRPGVSLAQAQADMAAIAAQTAAERPRFNAKWSATVVPLMEQTVGATRTTLLVLLGAVGFVLLIACANVSNLLLMRAAGRRREMTVRVALGAGLGRLLHQLLVETLLLALTGGALGFALAWWGLPAIIHMLPADFPLPRLNEIAVDFRVLGFALLLSLACGLFFGLLPAIQVDRNRVIDSLREGGRHGTSSSRHLRAALVVGEVAVAMILVIGAGLMLCSFVLLDSVDPGFRPERLLTFQMMLVPSKYFQIPKRAAVVENMLEKIRTLPSVTSAAYIHLLPLSRGNSGTFYSRADRAERRQAPWLAGMSR